MNSITTIEELVDQFDDAAPSEQVSVLKRIDIPVEDFESYATWCEDGYTRNCIARNDEFEFILLCWSEGAKTPIHGHAGQDCWVFQVDGKVKETRLKENSEEELQVTNELTLTEGRLAYMHDRMGYHCIENESSGRAMTLHIYASPIDSCKVFNEDSQKFEVVEMEYDTNQCDALQKAAS